MRIGHFIEGTVTVPDGSIFLQGAKNQIILPDGKVISMQPVVEMASSQDADDHKNLNYEESKSIGVLLEDYDRVTYEFDNMIIPAKENLETEEVFG